MPREIFITITNIKSLEIKMDFIKKEIYYNGQKKDVDFDLYYKTFCNIIQTWKEKYKENNIVIDIEKYNIKIYFNDGKTITYEGCSTSPDNYLLFKKLVGDYYD